MEKEITEEDKVLELCFICDKLAVIGEMVRLTGLYNPQTIEDTGYSAGKAIVDYARDLCSKIHDLPSFLEKYYGKKTQAEAQAEYVSSFLSEIEKARKIIEINDPPPGQKMHQLQTKVLIIIDEFVKDNHIAKILKIREETSKIVNGLIDQLNAEERERRASAKAGGHTEAPKADQD